MPSAMKVRRVPQRTCIACRTNSGKRDLIRLVRTPEGSVEVDTTSKANGRGAYVCAQQSCWGEALTKDRLSRALRTTISADVRERLQRFAHQLDPVTVEMKG